MLKQSFNIEAISKIISKRDVWKWSLWNNNSEHEKCLIELERKINSNKYSIAPFKEHIHKNKKTFQASSIEDTLSIKLLDKYLRRIYKVKQSDRQKLILQIKSLLTDNEDFKIIRLDIEKCYESINFSKILSRLESDMLLAPNCLQLLNSIHDICKKQKISGLPRGLSISPTLTELFLEKIDKGLKHQDGVIYFRRYVDDYFIIVECGKESIIEGYIINELDQIGLNINKKSDKYAIAPSRNCCFDYLGYNFSTKYKEKKGNTVNLCISNSKLSRIKSKIALSFNDYKTNKNFNLLKQRINYLSSIRIIKKHENGTLLGGIAYSYCHVTDDFELLKKIDGFYIKMINSKRFGLTVAQQNELKKKSFYGFVKNKKKSTFTRKKVQQIVRIWKNA
ncbi:MAG: RNA-directed DNA polymerase [Gilliamella sp.]|uniref:antiviral reverse transcriptase Drt3a n=1 Tax=Gilliamella sp. TaxID=1891236 RepID=UPI00261C1EAD|nr:antiviral reverse transcriptase Drt3a [Gilliamella sp.]MCO6551903.1 RNA-directed DNA polymerase [Gilliamella sp.]